MTKRGDRSGATAEPYSPHRRTAVLFAGVGTAGAYHAGVLRALHEAGVKIDIVAGRGIGAVSALFTAVDGAARLWEENGFWHGPSVAELYPWHPWLRLFARAAAVAMGVVILPLALMALGLIVFPIDFLLKMLGLSGEGLTGIYLRVAAIAFSAGGLPTWLPRIAILALGAAVMLAAVSATVRTARRRERGPLWWRMVPAPLTHDRTVERCWSVLWDLVRGAAHVRQPDDPELARRYAELLAENIGQPGFRELLLTVYDIDARRDIVCAAVADMRRRSLIQRPSRAEEEQRRAEVIDLSLESARVQLADVIAAAMTVPLATDWETTCFPSESYWRGETHRLGDRASSLMRLVHELAGIDAEQVIVISAAPVSAIPHELVPTRLDGRGRIGEQAMAAEAAALQDVLHTPRPDGMRLFVIRPDYNPMGPFDFAGGFDERSHRPQPLAELKTLGYEDAFRQFIEPVVAPSGDRVGLMG